MRQQRFKKEVFQDICKLLQPFLWEKVYNEKYFPKGFTARG